MKIGVCIESARPPLEEMPLENVPIFCEKCSNSFHEWISFPMSFHASDAYIDLAVVFTVHFSVNVHMEQRLLLIEMSPVVQGLVEGVMWEVFFEEVIGINICLADEIGNSPIKE